MEERKHALLSASSAKRWLNCPPSAQIEKNFEDKGNIYAAEGTFIHELCEYKIKHDFLHVDVDRPSHDTYDTPEADEISNVYYNFCITEIQRLRDLTGFYPLILTEYRVDFSNVVPEGFGTCDLILLAKDLLHIIDFKAGKGVFVEVNKNPQLMLYAIGAINAFNFMHKIKKIKLSIVQPRLNNIATYVLDIEDLTAWADSIKPIAKTAYEGKGEQKIGDWCKFCKAHPVCAAWKDKALEIARKDFNLTPENSKNAINIVPLEKLATLLPFLSYLSDWINSVFSYCSEQAINHGKKIPGYKVVEGQSRRVFTDPEKVIEICLANGFKKEEIFKTELLSLASLEKLLGKKQFAELLGAYIEKPAGKLILVPENDKRPEVKEFEKITEEE